MKVQKLIFLESKDENETLAPIPIDIGLKSAANMGKEVAGVKSQTCELCKMAVAKVDEFIADPTNDVSF